MRLVEKVEVKVMTNLEGNVNLALELLVTIVASWVTRNLNAKFSKEIRRSQMSSQTKLTHRRKKRNALCRWRQKMTSSSYEKTTTSTLHVMIVLGQLTQVFPSTSVHTGFFSSYRSGDFGTTKMGNFATSKIVGIGDVTLMTDTGYKFVLMDGSQICTSTLSKSKSSTMPSW